jgi:hypothetical protein
LPEGAEIAVKVGDNVKGGSSVIARMTAGVIAKKRGEGSQRTAEKI